MIRLTISLPLDAELEAQCKELTLDNSKLPPTVVRSAALQGVSRAGFKLNKVSYDWGTAILQVIDKALYTDRQYMRINIPDHLKELWSREKFSYKQKLDMFLVAVKDLPDAELLKVFEYTYEDAQPHIAFPVSK